MNDFEEKLFRHAERVREGMKPLDIDPEAGERNEKNMPKKRIGLIIAAVIVAVAGLTAVAASLNWDAKLLEYLNLTPEQAEKLENSAAYPNLSATDAGVTVTVRQTLSDSHGLYVLYDVAAPEGFEFSDGIEFVGAYLEVPCADEGSVSCTWDNHMLSHSGNKSTWLLKYDNTTGITDGKLRLTLDMLGYRKPRSNAAAPDGELDTGDGTIKYAVTYDSENSEADARTLTEREKVLQEKLDSGERLTRAERILMPKLDDYVTLFDGHWELAWDFKYENQAIVLEPDLAVHDENGREYTVKRLELSPMSICMDVEQNFEQNLEPVPVPSGNTDGDGKVVTVEVAPQPPLPVINMKDGTKAALEAGYPGGAYMGYFDGRTGGMYYLNIGFDDGIIDLENVESITYGDKTIEIK